MDATVETALATRFEVQGFPTLKYFRGGADAADYGGPRDAQGIAAWLRKRSGPATVAVATVADVEALTAKNDVVLLAIAASADSAFATTFGKVAAAGDEGVFALAAGGEAAAALRAHYGVAGEAEELLALNNFPGQDNVVRFGGEEASASVAELDAWVAAQSLPVVVVFSQTNAPKIFAGALKTHVLLFADAPGDAADADAPAPSEAHAAAISAFIAAAKANTEPLLFVRVPSSEDRVVSYFGIDAAAMPTAVLVSMGDAGMKKYKFSGDAAVAADYTALAAAYTAGTLKPWLKSEPAPDAAANAAADVRVITGSNFDAEVINSDADVLLEVYAPGCAWRPPTPALPRWPVCPTVRSCG